MTPCSSAVVVALLPTLAFGVAGGAMAQGALAAGAEARERALEREWSRDLGQAWGRDNLGPAKRVVELLGKMKAQLEAEAANEEGMYEKMVCWCETNEKEKSEAIRRGEAAQLELEEEIETRGAKFGELETEIAALKKQVAANAASLKQATAIKESESSEFRGEETDLVQAIDNLRNAIAVLSRHQAPNGTLLAQQVDAPTLMGLRVVLRDAALKHEALLATRAAPRRIAFLALGSVANTNQGGRSQGSAASAGGAAFQGGMVSEGQRLLDFFGVGAADDDLPLKLAERLLTREAAAAKTRDVRTSFLQATSSGRRQPLYASYSTRSDKIFGVLTQMLEDFEAELKSAQGQEASAMQSYKGLAAAKESEIAAGKEKLDAMEVQHAANQKALEDAKQALERTSKQRSTDVEFLRNLRLTCNDLDSQWEKRSTTRTAELKAVTEAIAILTGDDNREQLVKGGVAFLQVGRASTSTALSQARAAAARALRRAAESPAFEAGDLLAAWRGRRQAVGDAAPGAAGGAGLRAQLSTLAMSVQLDSFDKVKDMMDKLVAELKSQQEEEVSFKANCEAELRGNEKARHAKANEKQDLEANIEQLDALLEQLAAEIGDAKAQIAEAELQMKRASEAREAENAEFQTVVADQRATQDILKKALHRLEDYYKKGSGKVVLAQRSAQTPPLHFNTYTHNAGSSPVMGLLEQIIEDSTALEADATASESKAQADYETFVKGSNEIVAELSESVASKTKAAAAAKVEKSAAESGHLSAVGELESLASVLADLHGECDFVLKNFQIRQKARLQEIEAIQEAKGILAGAGQS